MKERIPVFLSSDNNYSPFIATTIISIMEHTQSAVDFYILDGGIYEENKKKILKLKKKFPNIKINFLKINTQKEFKNFPTRIHFTIDMYTRFLIPRLMPSLDKVIYSDVDVIFNGDIKEIYNEPLNGYPLGAVPYIYGYLNPDTRQITEFHKRLKLPDSHKYFESGLLLIDCEQWREKKYTEKLSKKAQSCAFEKILTPDQDVFNIVFANNYQPLDNKYIVTPGRTYVMSKNKKASKSITNPFIFHYTGSKKPWDFPEIEYAEYFWKYAKKTEFYNHLKWNLMERMKIEILEHKKRKFRIFSPYNFFLQRCLTVKMFILKLHCRYQIINLARINKRLLNEKK